MTPEEFRAGITDERRHALAAARSFARACAEGDVEAFLHAADDLSEAVDGWRHAMRLVARLPQVRAEVRDAFLSLWVQMKMLPLSVGHRPTMAAALRILMPTGAYQGGPLRLYRGTTIRERQRRLYGFSWTTRFDVAQQFAKHWQDTDAKLQSQGLAISTKGVVLESIVLPEAILLMREDGVGTSYDEGEVVVDPFRLGKVEVAERLAPISG